MASGAEGKSMKQSQMVDVNPDVVIRIMGRKRRDMRKNTKSMVLMVAKSHHAPAVRELGISLGLGRHSIVRVRFWVFMFHHDL